MFTLENVMIAFIAMGVLFLILGLIVLSNTHKLLKNQHKDFELLVDFIEEKMKPTYVGVDVSNSEALNTEEFNSLKANINTLIEVVQSVDTKIHNFDTIKSKDSIEETNHYVRMADLPTIKTVVNDILKNLKEQADNKAVINITPVPNQSEKTAIDTNNTGGIILAAIAVTEIILSELHDVETIYNDKGEVLEKIFEDYNKTYESVFKTLTENLL